MDNLLLHLVNKSFHLQYTYQVLISSSMIRMLLFLFSAFLLYSCAATKTYQPGKKFPKATLQQDLSSLRKTLEANHPSLYWYSTKDSIDKAFSYYGNLIEDSMTEVKYAWKVITPIIAAIKCGHTSVSYSKGYARWTKDKVFSSFPLVVAAWGDTVAVRGKLIKKDSIFKKGTLLTSINGVPVSTIKETFFKHLPTDGYSDGINYLRISSSFPRYHNNEYGLSKMYNVGYIDSASGKEAFADLPVFEIKKDTTKKKDSSIVKKLPKPIGPTKLEKKEVYRKFKIDSTGTYGMMDLNGFTKGGLRRFFRKTFREVKQKNIQHLVIDLRSNGGGRVDLSTLLTKYISRKPFKVADSAFMKTKFIKDKKHLVGKSLLINIGLVFTTKKKSDGNYHAGRIERKLYQPKKRNHYDGKLYVLVAGGSFSATTVFTNAIKGQKNILVVGEETGGGWYGNNGLFIPDITLPNTKLRIRLPLYRVVQYNHIDSSKGSGIIPDITVPVTYDNFSREISLPVFYNIL